MEICFATISTIFHRSCKFTMVCCCCKSEKKLQTYLVIKSKRSKTTSGVKRNSEKSKTSKRKCGNSAKSTVQKPPKRA